MIENFALVDFQNGIALLRRLQRGAAHNDFRNVSSFGIFIHSYEIFDFASNL